MAYEQRASWFGIRRQIILLFLLLALLLVVPTVSFVRWWLVVSQKQLNEKLFAEGYKTFVVYVDQKRGVLETLARSYGRHQAVRALVAGPAGAAAGSDIPALKRDARLDLFSVVDARGRVIGGDKDVELFTASRLAARQAGWPSFSREVLTGFFYDASGRLWLLAQAPLEGEGAPATSVVVGYHADEVFLDAWAQPLGFHVDVYRHAPSAGEEAYFPATERAGVTWKELRYSQRPYLIRRTSSDGAALMFLAAVLRDIRGEAVAVLILRRAAPFGTMPQHSFLNFLWVILVLFFGFLCVAIRFFTDRITRPVVDLRRAIRDITSSGNLAGRLHPAREDEMGRLMEEFNKMLEKLEASSASLNRSQKELTALYNDLLEQKRFTSEIVATAPSIVLVLLPDGRVKFINDASSRIMGFRPEEVIGRQWVDNFVPFRHREEVRKVFEEILRGEIQPHRQHESKVLTKEGHEHIILWSNSVIADDRGRLLSVLAIGMDITRWKETERDLRQKMTQLERFVKVTMDRERVIMELKREVKRLKGVTQDGQGGHGDL